MTCKNCLHHEVCTAPIAPARCCFFRDQSAYIKTEQAAPSVQLKPLLARWYAQCEKWEEEWKNTIKIDVDRHHWAEVKDCVKMCDTVDLLVDKYPEMWEQDFVYGVYEKLSSHQKQDFLQILDRLISYHDLCASGLAYKRLEEIYKCYVMLIQNCYILEEKRPNVFKWLWCRYVFWMLKHVPERRS